MGSTQFFMPVGELRAGPLREVVLAIEVFTIKIGKQLFTDLFRYSGPVAKQASQSRYAHRYCRAVMNNARVHVLTH